VQLRAHIGADISIADLISDIYVTYRFYTGDGTLVYFQAQLVSLSICIVLQVLLVFGQNRNLGMKRVFLESIPCFLGLKTLVDAHRISTGTEQQAGQAFDPMTETAYIKCIELFTEAIPGVIIQLMAILGGGETLDKEAKIASFISLAMASFSAGFISASISYDWDTDEGKRATNPQFYGFTPDSTTNKVVVFSSLMIFSSGILITRCTTIVLLANIGKAWAFTFFGIDLSLYMLIKVVRGDFWYWVPFGGNYEIASSIFFRVGAKIISDYIGLVQLRHPLELGGLIWSLNVCFTLISLPISLFLYTAQKAIENTLEEQLTHSNTNSASKQEDFDDITNIGWSLATYLIPLIMIALLTFFLNIKREYLSSFYSTQTGIDCVAFIFRNSKTERGKITEAVEYSQHLTKPIRQEIVALVRDNWFKWEEEKPKWLSPAMRHAILINYLPVETQQHESFKRSKIVNEKEDKKLEKEWGNEGEAIKGLNSKKVNFATQPEDIVENEEQRIEQSKKKAEKVEAFDPVMEIFAQSKKKAEKVEAFDPVMDIFAQSKKKAEKVEAFDPVMDIFAQAKKKAEKVEAFDPVMDIFAQSKKKAEKVEAFDPVMDIFEQSKKKAEKVEAFDPVMDIFAQSKKKAEKVEVVDPVIDIDKKSKEKKEQKEEQKEDPKPVLQQDFWKM
jgi:hypothetical protein